MLHWKKDSVRKKKFIKKSNFTKINNLNNINSVIYENKHIVRYLSIQERTP